MTTNETVRVAWLERYRRNDVIAVSPYTFDAGNGPGIDTVDTIVAIGRMAGCVIDPGASGHPIYLRGLPKDDGDLEALLEMCHIQPELP